MSFKNTKEELNRFAKYVIKQARTNLSKQRKNTSKDLYGSLGYDLSVGANSFSLEFYMLPYGIYVDKGVSGTKQKYDTIFSYSKKQPPSDALAKWAKSRNIRLRDEKGRYKKGNYKSIGFLIARSIKEKGIKPSLFFTKPFEKAFENLPAELIESFNLDIDDLLDFTT